MNEVERIARALYEEYSGDTRWEELGDGIEASDEKGLWRRLARTSLKALRATVETVSRAATYDHHSVVRAHDCWRGMIDAILAEAPKPEAPE